jgi:transposase InsO family protein
MGLAGAVRGKTVRTTVSDKDGVRAPDLVKRQFTAGAPNRLWVADFTYVSTWAGTVYTAFGIDVFSRRIVGWTCSMSKETDLVLDAIEMGLRERAYRWEEGEDKLVHHSDAGSQYQCHLVKRCVAGLRDEGRSVPAGGGASWWEMCGGCPSCRLAGRFDSVAYCGALRFPGWLAHG